MAGESTGQDANSVLYIEDDDETRRCIGNRLRRRGFLVWEAASGQAAVDAVSNGARPDVVLLDLDLPDMDGLQAHSRVTEQHPGSDPAAYSHPATWVVPVLVGILLAVSFELWAVHAVHRWQYASMPLVPLLHVGVTPVSQMIVIPAAATGLCFRVVNRCPRMN